MAPPATNNAVRPPSQGTGNGPLLSPGGGGGGGLPLNWAFDSTLIRKNKNKIVVNLNFFTGLEAD